MQIPELTMAEVPALVEDGACLAVGGAGLQRKPIAALAALAKAGRRDLTVVSFLGSVDVELLLAAGAVADLHSAGVSLDGAGLAPLYRATRQDGVLGFHEWSEGTLLCALEAAQRGVPSLPTWMALDTDLPGLNTALLEGSDPFTGERVMHVRALAPDLALLHVPAIDLAGNAYVDGDFAIDGALARAARQTVVCYEEIIESDPARAALSRLWVDYAVSAPGGAWPTGCHPLYQADMEAVGRWAASGSACELDSLTRELSTG